MLWSRHLKMLESLADYTLYLTQAAFLARMDYSHRNPLLSGPAGTARTMVIYSSILWEPIVYHMGQITHVKTARRDIGSHKNGHHTVTELLHHNVALLLGEVSVQSLGIVAVLDQIVGNLLGVTACAAEHYGVYPGRIIHNSLESKILVAGIHHIIYVANIFRAFIARAHHNLLIVTHVMLGYLQDVGRHCGREQKSLMILGHM